MNALFAKKLIHASDDPSLPWLPAFSTYAMMQVCKIRTDGFRKGWAYCADGCEPNPCKADEVCTSITDLACSDPSTCPHTYKCENACDKYGGNCGENEVNEMSACRDDTCIYECHEGA